MKHFDLKITNVEWLKSFGFQNLQKDGGGSQWIWSDLKTLGMTQFVFLLIANVDKNDLTFVVFDRRHPGPPPTEGMTAVWIEDNEKLIIEQLKEANII